MLGTQLSGTDPAPSFQLQDQFGETVSLADYSGKVTVLTFLYTYCPDICPIVAGYLKSVHRMLDEQAADVAIVAITVDPERDTVERAYEYSERWGMVENWAFLVGDEEQLSRVWQAYYLAPPAVLHAVDEQSDDSGDETSQSGSVATLSPEIASKYLVDHSAPVYLIDRKGLMRVLFTLPFDPADLVHDIRLLLD